MAALSIIIPVYNKEAHIDSCIQSVLNQSFTDFEIILVNDGSTDTSGDICLAYEQQDSRVVVINQENMGVSAARNTGINHATGYYIGFIDSDDTIEPDMYQLLMDNALSYNADISVCRLRVIFPEKAIIPAEDSKLVVLNHDDALSACLKGDLDRSANNKIYKLPIVRDIKFEGSIYEDILYSCKVFLKAQKTVLQNSVKYNYILRGNSASMSAFNPKYMETIKVSAAMVELVSGENPKCLLDAQVFDIISNISLLNLLLLIGKKDYPAEYNTVIRNLDNYKSIINSNILKPKHRYALKIFHFSPRLYTRLMYWYGRLTDAEVVKRTRKPKPASV
ncbi:glycosyltransferase [Mucilaginibacter jinjuensis]|uniref:Glycosyltransferase n=1 Tax=Mucilaginibacter jinjuensis TaxID=1176721 RepID=A0ABY7T2Q4_9SPHI|nr:glycosyltransferase [Mucilaginibacter jinjuensis]WCT10725.1 glycosyltransferase [Mucilaginibacter jinjuensis]